MELLTVKFYLRYVNCKLPYMRFKFTIEIDAQLFNFIRYTCIWGCCFKRNVDIYMYYFE